MAGSRASRRRRGRGRRSAGPIVLASLVLAGAVAGIALLLVPRDAAEETERVSPGEAVAGDPTDTEYTGTAGGG